MRTSAYVLCMTCDERGAVFRDESGGDEAHRQAEADAAEHGWLKLEAKPPQRFHATWMCPACVVEVRAPVRQRLGEIRERLEVLMARVDALIAESETEREASDG